MKIRRWVIMAGCVALIAITGYLNFRINASPGDGGKDEIKEGQTEQDSPSSAAATDEGDYFSVFKSDRDAVREKEFEYLDTIALSEDEDSDTRKAAQEQKLALVDAMEKEVTIEGLVRAKGFARVAVTVQKGSVNVVVGVDQLQDSEVAQILSIAQKETGEKAENIKVMTTNS